MSILRSEIDEQPDVIASLLREESSNIKLICKEISGRFKYVVIAARGTSDNAARYAQYLFGAYNQLQVALATPSLFTIYGCPPDLSNALIIGISQSGQSPDIVSVIKEGKRQGCPTLAITNNPGSPLALEAHYVIPLHAGIEKAIAATKTYTSSLAAMALFSCWLKKDAVRLNALNAIPIYIKNAIMSIEPRLEHIERYRYMEHCTVIGRGYNYSTAFEIALKVKELTGVVAEPYSSADFRHGPIATVNSGFPVFLIAPKGAISMDLSELMTQLTQRGAEKIIISDDPDILTLAQFPLSIPAAIPEWLSPLVAVIPGQLFGMQLAIERGRNPDNPQGLSKVTETY